MRKETVIKVEGLLVPIMNCRCLNCGEEKQSVELVNMWLCSDCLSELVDMIGTNNTVSKTEKKAVTLKDIRPLWHGNLDWEGSLYLYHTKITELPDDFTVSGDLDLLDTPIAELPDNLTVGGRLHLSNTPITELPNNLTVGGNIYVNKGQLTNVPKHLKGKIREFPKSLDS